MATVAPPPATQRRLDRLERIWKEPSGLVGWLTTVDHKRIGILYFFTSLAFFALGGLEALLIRTQLIGPNGEIVSPEFFNQLMSMHGITMIFLAVIPMQIGAFGNYLLPLMIGARDMAFPRLNALSYWIFLASGLFIYSSMVGGTAPNAGWFDYVPLASRQYTPGPNIDFYTLGLIFTGIATSATAINFIVTIFKLRAPGMSLNRMPLFAFAILAVSFATRSCGSTCSGSSVTRRSTSSSCPRSASRPRSSRRSASGRWSPSRSSRWPRSSSRSSGSGCGHTTCWPSGSRP